MPKRNPGVAAYEIRRRTEAFLAAERAAAGFPPAERCVRALKRLADMGVPFVIEYVANVRLELAIRVSAPLGRIPYFEWPSEERSDRFTIRRDNPDGKTLGPFESQWRALDFIIRPGRPSNVIDWDPGRRGDNFPPEFTGKTARGALWAALREYRKQRKAKRRKA